MSSSDEEYMVIGYQKAQKEIATKLLAEDMKASFVALVTNLSEEVVERIRLDHSPRIKKIIRNMVKDGVGDDIIAKYLEVPLGVASRKCGFTTLSCFHC